MRKILFETRCRWALTLRVWQLQNRIRLPSFVECGAPGTHHQWELWFCSIWTTVSQYFKRSEECIWDSTRIVNWMSPFAVIEIKINWMLWKYFWKISVSQTWGMKHKRRDFVHWACSCSISNAHLACVAAWQLYIGEASAKKWLACPRLPQKRLQRSSSPFTRLIACNSSCLPHSERRCRIFPSGISGTKDKRSWYVQGLGFFLL